MKSKINPLLFVILLALAALFLYKLNGLRQNNAETEIRNERFDRRISSLIYTKHALCRMDCRHISKTDVEDIMRSGDINYAKSDFNDKPCPTYALQGVTTDGQHLRVIFAQCSRETRVVTCYDLDHEFECHCPGDEKKNHY